MSNILTFDLEDWYQLCHLQVTGELVPARDSLLRQTNFILELLDRHDTKATFFILGIAARGFPGLIRQIADAGHEVASHGHDHLTVYRLTRQQFSDDTRKGKELIEDITGHRVAGYRAAAFSITQRSLWGLEILAELGFEYDSSVFPVHHRRYGIPEFLLAPARYALPNGLSIVEIPLATLDIAGLRLPVAGGGYFRLLPQTVLAAAIRSIERKRRPFMTYFHPYEFDDRRANLFETTHPASLKQKIHAYRVNWHQNLRRHTVASKLDSLMWQFRFLNCKEFLNGTRLQENADLLSRARAEI